MTVTGIFNLIRRISGSLGVFLMIICATHVCQLDHSNPLDAYGSLFALVKERAHSHVVDDLDLRTYFWYLSE